MTVDVILDGLSTQTKFYVKLFYDQVGATLKTLERAIPWENRIEPCIRLLKEGLRKDMRESNSPMFLWDYEIDLRALIHNAVPLPLFQDQDKTPHE